MNTILQLNAVSNFGSTGRIVEGIGNVLIKNGWKSYIGYGRARNSSSSELIKIGSYYDVYLHVLQTRLFDMHGLGSSFATLKLMDKIDRINPDIIHLHNIHGYYLNYKVLFEYLKRSETPVVWTLHDCWPFTGHCAYFDMIKCDKWRTCCHQCPQKTAYPKSLFIDNSRNNFEIKKELFTMIGNMILVPVSIWLKSLVEESFLNTYRSVVIHNGVDLSVFLPKNSQYINSRYNLNGTFIILGVAFPWSDRKGLKDFITLAKILRNNQKIILIGVSKTQKKQVEKYGIIGIESTQDQHELASWYSRADVFLNPTMEDNFPTTNIEALACGTPVITYNTGGSPEAIDEKSGFVIEKGDIQGIFNCLQVIQTKGKSAFKHHCRQRAENFFNKNDRYMEYLKLYESLLV